MYGNLKVFQSLLSQLKIFQACRVGFLSVVITASGAFAGNDATDVACANVFSDQASAPFVPLFDIDIGRIGPYFKPVDDANPRRDEPLHPFLGLTPHGLQVLKQNRDAVRAKLRLFNRQFRNLNAAHHGFEVARLMGQHMMINGRGGGAKSKFVKFELSNEMETPFRIQLHEMMTQEALVGGEDWELKKKGIYLVNTNGTLVTSRVAHIDETEKGNPALFAALLTITGPEREALLGSRTVPTKLKTLVVTGNATLAEFHRLFAENGMATTAGPFFNRFTIKANFPNWIPGEDQYVLDQVRRENRFLAAIQRSFPEVQGHEALIVPAPIDWESLREIAFAMFDLSELSSIMLREIENELKDKIHEAIRDSEEAHRTKPQFEPYVYFPTWDPSERSRQSLPEVVIASAFIDFLLSPLADDGSIEHLVTKRVELDPLSLWRIVYGVTDVGPGNIRLDLPSDVSSGMSIDWQQGVSVKLNFDFPRDTAKNRTALDNWLMTQNENERIRFREILENRLKVTQRTIETSARFAPRLRGRRAPVQDESFELHLLRK